MRIKIINQKYSARIQKNKKVLFYQFITRSVRNPKLELFYNNYALEHDFMSV